MLNSSMIRGISFTLMVLIFAGCVRHDKYRTSFQPCEVKTNETLCEKSVIEEQDGYLLGFIEFDDQGWFWDRNQLKAVIDTLQSKEYLKSGVIMLVFVHGWKHNADFADENVQEFRNTLRLISKIETLAGQRRNRPPRKVAGIYAGWRGQSVPIPLIENLTFWDRKGTANTVGHGTITEMLIQLENVKQSHNDVYEKGKPGNALTRLIVVGHSFGGQIVHSALSQILYDRFAGDESHPPQVFGDMVILVNPAFEAARFTPLWEASQIREWYPDGQLPLLTIFTAKNDDATGMAFPIGRRFSTFFERHRDSFEKSANRRTVGHFEPYITHELTWVGDTQPAMKSKHDSNKELSIKERDHSEISQARLDIDTTQPLSEKWRLTSREKGWSNDFGNARLTHLGKTHPLNPFYNVSVDREIIDGHGGIWKPEFTDFLRRFILFSVITPGTKPEEIAGKAKKGKE